MENPPHNDAFSYLTDPELVRFARVFARPQGENQEALVEALDNLIQALAGRLEEHLSASEK